MNYNEIISIVFSSFIFPLLIDLLILIVENRLNCVLKKKFALGWSRKFIELSDNFLIQEAAI